MKKTSILLIIILFIIIFSYFKIQHNPYDFNLRSNFKEETSLKDFKGDKLIIYFGYTFCPDICPATLSLIGQFLQKINNSKAHLLFISLDPQRDNNVSATNEWVQYFYPKANALIAKNENILQEITKRYKVQYQRINLNDSAMKYSIAHSNMIFLIDENGKFQKIINDLNPEEVEIELRKFLSSK